MTPLPFLRMYVQASHDLVIRAVPGKSIQCDHNKAHMGRFLTPCGHRGVPPCSHERRAAVPHDSTLRLQ